MTPLLSHLRKAFTLIGLLVVVFFALSCGGGGGASAGNNGGTLPVLRTYSGKVTKGALTLSDPQTGASIAVQPGTLSDGSQIVLKIKNGVAPSLNAIPGKILPVTYSLILNNSQLLSTPSITVNLPIPTGSISPSLPFIVILLSSEALDYPFSELATISADGKSMQATITKGTFMQVAKNSSSSTMIEVNFTASTLSAPTSPSSSILKQPSLYIYSNAQGTTIPNTV